MLSYPPCSVAGEALTQAKDAVVNTATEAANKASEAAKSAANTASETASQVGGAGGGDHHRVVVMILCGLCTLKQSRRARELSAQELVLFASCAMMHAVCVW